MTMFQRKYATKNSDKITGNVLRRNCAYFIENYLQQSYNLRIQKDGSFEDNRVLIIERWIALLQSAFFELSRILFIFKELFKMASSYKIFERQVLVNAYGNMKLNEYGRKFAASIKRKWKMQCKQYARSSATLKNKYFS